MKLFPFFPLSIFLFFSFTNQVISTPGLAKRTNPTGQPIADVFASIAKTIGQLDMAQTKAGQNGKPDFSLAAGGLAQLSVEAEKGEGLLNAMGNQQLDQESANKVKQSLYESASHVQSITSLIQQGKDYFQKNNVTEVVVQILQANVYTFVQLFTNLNKHSPPDRFPDYDLYESNVVCSMVYGIKELNPNQVSQSDLEKCYSGNYFKNSPTNSAGDSITPPGFSGCQNSPATFYQSAYGQQTMGTPNTVCPSIQKVSANSFTKPKDPLLLNSKKKHH